MFTFKAVSPEQRAASYRKVKELRDLFIASKFGTEEREQLENAFFAACAMTDEDS